MSGRISVVIPAHNRVRLLCEAVDSVANQTIEDLELIVVDDRSEPPVSQTVKNVWCAGRPDERVRTIRQEDGNGNTARNTGLQHATGEFIQFMDSDDLLHPEKLAIQVQQLGHRTDLDFVVSYEQFFQRTPGDCGRVWNTDSHHDRQTYLERFLNHDTPWNTGGPLWRSAFVRKIGGWAPELQCWQDWEFHTRALLSGANCKRTPSVLYFRRDHDQEVCVSSLSQQQRETNVLRAVQLVLSQIEQECRKEDQRWLHCLLETYLLRRCNRIAGLGAEGHQTRRDLVHLALNASPSFRRRMLYRVMNTVSSVSLWKRLASQLERTCPSLPQSQTYKQVIFPTDYLLQRAVRDHHAETADLT